MDISAVSLVGIKVAWKASTHQADLLLSVSTANIASWRNVHDKKADPCVDQCSIHPPA